MLARSDAAGVLQMNEWIRSSLRVQRGPASTFKAHFFVEAYRLSILLIDIGGHMPVKRQTMAYQSRTNARAAVSGVHEQGLHMPVIDEHECQRIVHSIYRQP